MREDDFIAAVPKNANPHLGYRGNIDGDWGGTTFPWNDFLRRWGYFNRMALVITPGS